MLRALYSLPYSHRSPNLIHAKRNLDNSGAEMDSMTGSQPQPPQHGEASILSIEKRYSPVLYGLREQPTGI